MVGGKYVMFVCGYHGSITQFVVDSKKNTLTKVMKYDGHKNPCNHCAVS